MKSKGLALFLVLMSLVLFAGCLQLDVETPEAPELYIMRAGNRVRVIDIDPEEEVTLSIADNVSGAHLVASAKSSSASIFAVRSGLDYIVKGISPGGMGLITFSAMNKTAELRVFVRNWAAGTETGKSIRHGLYADMASDPADPYAANKLVSAAGFDYEAPDGLSSGVPRTDAHELHDVPHIAQRRDEFLQRDVFAFTLHRSIDGDMVGGYRDRQRLELKTMMGGSGTPDMYSTGGGDTFTHRWKFRLPTDFTVSSEYTHLHQIKPEGGDSGNPTFTITARRKSNGAEVMQLIYRGPIRPNGDASQNTYPCEVPLKDFIGEWVRVEETVTYDSPGAYQIKVVRVRDLKTLMHYIYFPQKYEEYEVIDPFVMFRPGNTYIRPKFGVYRRTMHINSFGIPTEQVKDLKDVTVLFADLEMDKLR